MKIIIVNISHYKKALSIIFISIFFASCTDYQRPYEGAWVVGQAYYNNESVLWDMYSNVFYLNADNTCNLPIYDINDRHTNKERGHWSVYKTDTTTYIQIKTQNKIFNRVFNVQKIKRIPHPFAPGDQLKIILTADSLTFDCFKEIPL